MFYKFPGKCKSKTTIFPLFPAFEERSVLCAVSTFYLNDNIENNLDSYSKAFDIVYLVSYINSSFPLMYECSPTRPLH
ncbi:hypothetical protein Pint_05765 [Pistacia integerrima]|uniref:Uncharacterized protein n=1 Tax=Pistacia integerrima TaxID=434235 RepID=A0ACC0YZS7_9ROSI|nr:hypothetical protein Pint_05765 [Pistacia integerrima]